MDITITEKAVQWFKEEYDVKHEEEIRFFVRYGGFGGNIPAFSLGVSLEEPEDLHAKETVDNITFYVEDTDAWYFQDKDLHVNFNEQLNEPEFEYKE